MHWKVVDMADKRSVLMIGPHPSRSFGGMATVIGQIMNSEVIASRYEIDMWPSFVDGPLFRRAAYSISREIRFGAAKKLHDIYHIHVACDMSTWRKMRYVDSLGTRASRVVLHVHGSHYDSFFRGCSAKQREIIRRLYSKVGSVIVLSEEWREFFIANHICSPSKLVVIHNAVEVPVCNKTQYENENILFLGRLAERKSPETLLRAAPLVLERHPHARFIFAGDGNVNLYKHMAKDLGVADSCGFTGWVSGRDREGLFLGCSIFCLPSKSEGMPMSLLESMAHGLDCISTPVGGIPRVINDGVNGFLVDVEDHEALADRILCLLDCPRLKKTLGEAGRSAVTESFGMAGFAQKIMNAYERVGK